MPSPLTLADGIKSDSPIHIEPDALTDPLLTTSPAPFLFYPAFLSPEEQSVLLSGSLAKLDASVTPSREVRRKRKAWRAQAGSAEGTSDSFLPEELYDFEEGHYDGVIHDYREAHASFWPDDASISKPSAPTLSSILKRLNHLFLSHVYGSSEAKNPPIQIMTHVLHLKGAILPHVDNVDASGSIIMGVSLGATRVMRLLRREEGLTEKDTLKAFQVLLLPGSVYIQKDVIRYAFVHSIAEKDDFRGQTVPRGQRLSIMMRDQKLLTSL